MALASPSIISFFCSFVIMVLGVWSGFILLRYVIHTYHPNPGAIIFKKTFNLLGIYYILTFAP